MKCVCLQAMAVVYGRCYEEIGAFNDTRYIVGMLERVSRLSGYVEVIQICVHLLFEQHHAKAWTGIVTVLSSFCLLVLVCDDVHSGRCKR